MKLLNSILQAFHYFQNNDRILFPFSLQSCKLEMMSLHVLLKKSENPKPNCSLQKRLFTTNLTLKPKAYYPFILGTQQVQADKLVNVDTCVLHEGKGVELYLNQYKA